MQPTRRLLLILLPGAPLIALGFVGEAAAALVVLLALLGAAADWWLAGRGPRPAARRDVTDKLSLGAWNPVQVHVSNPLPRTVRLAVRDQPPGAFELDPATSRGAPTGGLKLTLAPGERASSVYRVRPSHRGSYAFGNLAVRVEGPLGLIRRDALLAGTGQPVQVYPDLRALRRYELLARRGVMEEAGTRPLRVAGASTEFERLREYLPGDEPRQINWKATARRGKLIANAFEATRSQNLVLVLDAGRLMAARVDVGTVDESAAVTAAEQSAGLTKLDYALNAALLLGYVATLRGDRVGMLAYADRVRAFAPPARGRRAFLSVVGRFYDLEAEPIEPDHALALQFLAGRNLHRSLVVVFTDLADRASSAALVAHLARASRHHQVVVVTLGDPSISRPAARAATDAQSLYEKMVAQQLLDERTTLLRGLAQQGVVTLDTDADHLSPRLVSTYLELKARARV